MEREGEKGSEGQRDGKIEGRREGRSEMADEWEGEEREREIEGEKREEGESWNTGFRGTHQFIDYTLQLLASVCSQISLSLVSSSCSRVRVSYMGGGAGGGAYLISNDQHLHNPLQRIRI